MTKLFASKRSWLVISGAVATVYFVLAYILLPFLWAHHEHEPGLASLPMVTRTSTGIPGDALNVGLVGGKEDVIYAMHASDWFPADAITLRTSIEIVGSVVLDRPYRDAPVSPLYYEGKKEQLAFEKPDGKSADKRHHVRLWQVLENGTDGRPVWLGSITFDRGVGFLRFKRGGRSMLDPMRADAFGMFLVHHPIALWLQYWLFDYNLPAIVKATVGFVLTVVFSWALTRALRQIPGATRVL